MKKLTSLLIIAVLIVGLTSCTREETQQIPVNSQPEIVQKSTEERPSGAEIIEPDTSYELPAWIESDTIEDAAFYYGNGETRLYFYEGANVCSTSLSEDFKASVLAITGCKTIEEAQSLLEHCIELIKAK